MDHDRDRPGARIAAAALLWGLGLGLVAGGCHVLLPYDNVDARADAPPDMTVDGAARLDGTPPPDAEPTPDVNSTLDAPAGPDQQLADHGPAGDQQPPDMALPDAPLPDQLVPDLPVPDVFAGDTLPPICYTAKTFTESFKSGKWIVTSGSAKAISAWMEFSDQGQMLRTAPKGLFCAPSGKGLRLTLKYYCSYGSFTVRLYDKPCFTSVTCKKHLLECSFSCSSGWQEKSCTASVLKVANHTIYAIKLVRPGGNGIGRAEKITLQPYP